MTVLSHAKFAVKPHPVCGDSVHDPFTYSGFWAGHVAPNSDYFGNAFDYAESTWIQPSVVFGSSPDSDWKSAPDASVWVGTDAGSGGNLIQAGADSISTQHDVFKFWIENVSGSNPFCSTCGTQWEDTPTVTYGDKVFVQTWYNGNQTTHFYLENETTGGYLSTNYPTPYVGIKRALFINERILGKNLPNFGIIDVSDNHFGDNSNYYTLNPDKNSRYVMTSNCQQSGTVLSEPDSVNDDGTGQGDFTHYWYAASPHTDTGC